MNLRLWHPAQYFDTTTRTAVTAAPVDNTGRTPIILQRYCDDINLGLAQTVTPKPCFVWIGGPGEVVHGDVLKDNVVSPYLSVDSKMILKIRELIAQTGEYCDLSFEVR